LSGDATHVQDVCGVLLDTKGPEIRSGKLQNDLTGHDTITLVKGDHVTLCTDDNARTMGSTPSHLYIDYSSLASAVQVGGKVLLDDGAISLTVRECHMDTGTVICSIDNTGTLRSRAGVNLPLADTSDLPALSEKDKADIMYGMASADIDYVAASFVQSAEGVHQIRTHIEQCARELQWDPVVQPLPLLISKIETAGALQQFDAILQASDGIMVARGDLGVEIPLQQVTNAQKEMIYACNAAGKVCTYIHT
jgi:pyruvate kinase